MKKRIAVLLSALLLAGVLGALPALAAAQPTVGPYDLFVSPQGDDAAAGTLEAPLRTVAAAKEKLKTRKGAVGEDETVRVWLRDGRYEFTETLSFTAEDLPNVTYAAYNGEKVVFSGAKEITGFAAETANGVTVFTKTLDPEKDPTGFHSLFSETEQLSVPRYPEEGYFTVKKLCPEDDLWTEENTPWEFTRGQRSFCADPADLTEFTNPTDVQVRILHYWHDELMYLTDVDYATGKLGLSRPSSMNISDIDRFYFENVFEALDEPGEWYLNTQTGKLYYVPEDGETADTLTLYASSLERLIDIDGADGIAFENIVFTQTDWTVPTPGEWEGGWRAENDIDALQAALDVKGVFTARHASDISVKNCEFRNLGADAVKLMEGVTRSRVDSCLFRHIAATAVFVGGANGEPGDPDVTADITVTNNDISGYGRKFFCAIGVHITYCDGAEVSHNEISDGYYTGISCGWTWGYTHHLTNNIKIRDNLIYNIGQGWLSDMGGIYMLGIQPGTELTGNVIHNVAADPGEGGYGGWGVYLDEGSSRMLVEQNLVYCCGSQSFNIHYGEGNVIRNNIGAFSAEGQVSPGSRDEAHATAYYYDNIFLTDKGAPIYIYMQEPAHFHANGNLFWNLSKGSDLRFSKNGGDDCLTLKTAQREGFLHNSTVADPLFADAAHYDFTLAEDSPAFALNFKAWDYDNAGTLKGTTIGTDQPGGGTAYNDSVVPVTPTGKKHSVPVSSVLLPVAVALGALLAAFWLAFALLRAPKAATVSFCVVLAGVLAGWFVYRTFVHWSPAPYVLGVTALCAAAAALPMCAPRERKKPVRSFLIRFVCVLAVFFAVVLTLNNMLRIGEVNVMSIALTALGVYAAAVTVKNLLAERNKSK